MAGKSKLPRVAVIGTGGTISSVGRDSLDIATYSDNKKKYEVDELLAVFPETAKVADLLRTLSRGRQPAIGPAEWIELVELIHRRPTPAPASTASS
jgi:L-asparaginase